MVDAARFRSLIDEFPRHRERLLKGPQFPSLRVCLFPLYPVRSLWMPCEQVREGDKKIIDRLTQISDYINNALKCGLFVGDIQQCARFEVGRWNE
jgi:hypothetical protein